MSSLELGEDVVVSSDGSQTLIPSPENDQIVFEFLNLADDW